MLTNEAIPKAPKAPDIALKRAVPWVSPSEYLMASSKPCECNENTRNRPKKW